jgi:flagellar motor switch protein FliN/FliY
MPPGQNQAATELPVAIRLGRTRMSAIEVAEIDEGMLVVLEQSVDELLDVFANDRLIARGEIIVVEDRFCVKITELVTHLNEVA